MQVGAERLGDSRRFAVELPDHQGAWAERLALSRSGDLTLHGQTTIRRERAQLDTFTGELFRLRSQWPFKAGDLNDLERLAGRLAHPETPLWHYLRRQLSTSARDKLDAYVGGDPEPAQLCPALVRNLNRALILAPLVDYLFIAGRTWPFSAGDLKDPSGLADGLIRGKTQPIGDEPFYRWLYQKLAPPAKKELAAYEEGNPITKSLLNAIVAALNKLIGQFDAGLPGDLHIRGASFRPLSAPPPAAAPWRLYRTGRTVDGVTSYELCAEIGGAGKQGDSARYRLAVGVFDRAAVRFRSCLSVTCGRVTVAGKLVVQGQLRESPIDLNPNDPRFGETLFQQLASGLALGFDTTSLQLTIAPVDAASYTITIENRSDQKITNINLYEILYVGNTPVRLNEQHRLQDLAAKGKAPLTLTIPDTGHARAVITVYGFRADFRLVYQAGEAVVR